MTNRRYLPTLGELIDRLSILQLKEIYLREHRAVYAEEIQDILHDLGVILDDPLLAKFILDVVILAQFNHHIWVNESNYRRGVKDGNNLELTHGLNGIRNRAKNRIQELIGGRKDYKIDCLAAEFVEWLPSTYEEKPPEKEMIGDLPC